MVYFLPSRSFRNQRLGLAILPQLIQERRPAIELRTVVQVPIQKDAHDVDRVILGVVELARGDQAVDHLDEVQLLLHREVSGQFIAAIEDLVGLRRHPGAGARVDLDDPKLVDIVFSEIVDRRVL